MNDFTLGRRLWYAYCCEVLYKLINSNMNEFMNVRNLCTVIYVNLLFSHQKI
jgi:hypothetical protein